MKTVQGNLLTLAAAGEFEYIFHGCNCFHLMGAGIARSIAEQYPDAEEVDQTTGYGDVSKLGDYTAAQVNNDVGGFFTIVNLYTQFKPGANFEYAALRSALDLFLGDLNPSKEPETIRCGFPLIGAGIGGGDWDIIQPMIVKAFEGLERFDITFVEFVP
jgi:O-acetyl-ADP-ribose deacetylase (regulator of RNase III)